MAFFVKETFLIGFEVCLIIIVIRRKHPLNDVLTQRVIFGDRQIDVHRVSGIVLFISIVNQYTVADEISFHVNVIRIALAAVATRGDDEKHQQKRNE